MEENNVKKLSSTETAKPSYEELEKMLKEGESRFNQLREQAQQIYKQLQDANMFNAFKRLDYLFKVLEFSHEFESEFVVKCVEEIQKTMTLDTAEEDKKEETVEK